MATTPTSDTPVETTDDPNVSKFHALTARISAVLSSTSPHFSAIRAAQENIAAMIVEARMSTMVTIKSKKSGKRVNLPLLDPRALGPATVANTRNWYGAWLRDEVMPVLEEYVTDPDDRVRFWQNVQNKVQDGIKDAATPSQLAHFGLSKTKKSDSRPKRRDRNESDGVAEAPVEINTPTDAVLATVVGTSGSGSDARPVTLGEGPVHVQCNALVALAEKIAEHVGNADDLSQGDRDVLRASLARVIEAFRKIAAATGQTATTNGRSTRSKTTTAAAS